MELAFEPRLESYSNVDSQKIEWLWEPYIPMGKVTILQGMPGIGKSFLTTAITKVVANGGAFPFSDNYIEPGNVILQNGEDGVNDTIKPRLDAQQVETKNVYFINENETNQFTLQKLDELRYYLEVYQPKLIVIDPITLYAGIKDFNSNTEVRRALSPIGKLAEEFNCAIILIYHLNKGLGTIANRTNGSIDSIALARSVLTVIESPDTDEIKLLFQTKCNVAKKGDCLSYKINELGCIEFIEKHQDLDIDSLMYQTSDIKFGQAKSFILGCLSRGEASANELQQFREAVGKITLKTFNSARSNLEKDNLIVNFKKGNRTYWKLVESPTPFEERK